ncbi:hypothetical protein MKY27_07810 [Solibacillus sp. FSL R5-0449]|uniref:hypothetical protein n=1 Tax=Solibacillus sp. FSL R5-0449 TaxID=2921639 RepID=UPI0030D21E37
MEKAKVGMILGIFSILPVIISVIYFYSVRGPNSDIYRTIAVLTILSIIGLITAGITSWILKGRLSRLVIGLIGIIANLAVLVVAFLLLLAMGISEP